MDLRALLFDFDGLIVDTETSVYQGWKHIYERHGETLHLKEYVQCVGSSVEHGYNPGDTLEERVGKRLDWDVLHKEKQEVIERLLEESEPLPGVVDLLAEAKTAGLPCVIASSSPHMWVDRWVANLKLGSYFQKIICRDDVGKPKPAPDLFIAAAKAAGIPHENALVLEDSENGLRAATAAGIRCCIVPNEITKYSNFQKAWKKLPSLCGQSLEVLAGDHS